MTLTLSHVNQIFEQQNFSNLYFVVLGEQILALQQKIDKIHNDLNKDKNLINSEERRITNSIQPPPEITDFKLKSTTEVEKIIREQFKNLNLNVLGEREEISENDNFEEEINKIGKYDNKPSQRIFYHPIPTPQDVLHEEREYIVNNNYNGKCIYEWNIDGYTNRQIHNLVHRKMHSMLINMHNRKEEYLDYLLITNP